MAELTKKLHFKKNTTEHMAKAYSTTAEAGAEYITNKIDGVTAYVPIGATNDSRATMGRVKKPNGAEKAILTMGKPPYTEKSWTTAGTYTFTVPAGVTRIRVAVCGGGSGSVAWESRFVNNYVSHLDGLAGEKSSFGSLVTATGGGAPQIHGVDDDEDGRWEMTGNGGSGGTPNGKSGSFQKGTGSLNGGDGHNLSFTNTSGSYGKGGACSTSHSTWNSTIASGGGGGYNTAFVNVTPTNTYTITVGSGSKGVTCYSPSIALKVNDGTSGFVLIAYGGDI